MKEVSFRDQISCYIVMGFGGSCIGASLVRGVGVSWGLLIGIGLVLVSLLKWTRTTRRDNRDLQWLVIVAASIAITAQPVASVCGEHVSVLAALFVCIILPLLEGVMRLERSLSIRVQSGN